MPKKFRSRIHISQSSYHRIAGCDVKSRTERRADERAMKKLKKKGLNYAG